MTKFTIKINEAGKVKHIFKNHLSKMKIDEIVRKKELFKHIEQTNSFLFEIELSDAHLDSWKSGEKGKKKLEEKIKSKIFHILSKIGTRSIGIEPKDLFLDEITESFIFELERRVQKHKAMKKLKFMEKLLIENEKNKK